MPEVRTKYNQSLLDIAIQEYGDLTMAMNIALENNISITAKLTVGSILRIPNIPSNAPEIQSYYQRKKLIPANDLSEATLSPAPSGIDYWAIGINFIVQ